MSSDLFHSPSGSSLLSVVADEETESMGDMGDTGDTGDTGDREDMRKVRGVGDAGDVGGHTRNIERAVDGVDGVDGADEMMAAALGAGYRAVRGRTQDRYSEQLIRFDSSSATIRRPVLQPSTPLGTRATSRTPIEALRMDLGLDATSPILLVPQNIMKVRKRTALATLVGAILRSGERS